MWYVIDAEDGFIVGGGFATREEAEEFKKEHISQYDLDVVRYSS